ncbi:MAG: TIGR01777 family oxidoreductase [Candidatus Omnitrophota bacterium]
MKSVIPWRTVMARIRRELFSLSVVMDGLGKVGAKNGQKVIRMKIVIVGGSGFIGSAVVERLLSDGCDVIVLSRRKQGSLSSGDKTAQAVRWDARTSQALGSILEGVDAVINLCGESVAAGRWTKSRKQILYESRLVPTQAIVEAIGACKQKPGVFINASAVGYYGDGADRLLDESAPKGDGFLADLCQAWEETALRARDFGVRTAVLRTGPVLDRGGFVERMLPAFRFFIGGPIGCGRQWIPWIWRQDLAEAVNFVIRRASLEGPVNCVGPEPVRMAEFCRLLGQAIGRPSWMPVPASALRLVLGQMSEILLKSQRVIPTKLSEAGFSCKIQTLTTVFDAILTLGKPTHFR